MTEALENFWLKSAYPMTALCSIDSRKELMQGHDYGMFVLVPVCLYLLLIVKACLFTGLPVQSYCDTTHGIWG